MAHVGRDCNAPQRDLQSPAPSSIKRKTGKQSAGGMDLQLIEIRQQ